MSELNRPNRNGEGISAKAASNHFFIRAASIRPIVRCIIVFAVSLILLVSAFSPLANTVAEIDGREYRIKLNSIDYVKMTVYSAVYYSESELYENSVYDDLLELGYTEGAKVTYYKSSTAEKMVKNLFFLDIMANNKDIKVSMLLGSAMAIGYLVFCILFFAKSAFSLIKTAIAMLLGHQVNYNGSKGVLSLLAYLLFAPVFRYVLLTASYFGKNGDMAKYSAGGVRMSGIFAFSVASALLAFALLMTHKLVNLSLDGELKMQRIKTEIISLSLCLVLLISFFLPVLSADMSIRYGNESNLDYLISYSSIENGELKIGYFDLTELSYSEIYYYSTGSAIDSERVLYDDVHKYLVIGFENDLDKTVHHTILVGCGRMDFTPLYITVLLLNALMLGIIAALSSKLIKKSIFAIDVKRVKLCKILLLMLTLAECAIMVVLSVLLNGSCGYISDLAISFKLGIGPAIAVICAIGMLLAEAKADESEKIVDRYYDNADVSYAPYVIGYKKNK